MPHVKAKAMDYKHMEEYQNTGTQNQRKKVEEHHKSKHSTQF
jgi:hypothetical protein